MPDHVIEFERLAIGIIFGVVQRGATAVGVDGRPSPRPEPARSSITGDQNAAHYGGRVAQTRFAVAIVFAVNDVSCGASKFRTLSVVGPFYEMKRFLRAFVASELSVSCSCTSSSGFGEPWRRLLRDKLARTLSTEAFLKWLRFNFGPEVDERSVRRNHGATLNGLEDISRHLG